MDTLETKKVLETLLFITDHPLSVERISKICETKEEKIKEALDSIQEDYAGKTLQIMRVAGGYQMATRREYAPWVRRLYHNRMTVRLSSAALETLAIIAYKQPITRADIEKIRGVEIIGPLETLIERRLVTPVGRKESVGRPMLYGTTDEFLRQFGLNGLEDLPSLEKFSAKKEGEGAENTEGSPDAGQREENSRGKKEETAGKGPEDGETAQ